MEDSLSATGSWKEAWNYKIIYQGRTLLKKVGSAAFKRVAQVEKAAMENG